VALDQQNLPVIYKIQMISKS